MKLIRLSLACMLGGTILSACVKQKFDAPPNTSDYDPQTPVNCKIQDLEEAGLSMASLTYRVLGDSTFSGIVVANDKSGNIYKKIIVEDTNHWGITLIIDKTYLYTDYPVGRRVYIKTKGLILYNYKGVPEIIYAVNPDNSTVGIPSSLITDYIVKGSYPHPIEPVKMTVYDLYANAYQAVNTLVTLTDMQFDNGSAGVVYSNPTSSTARYITNCDHTAPIQLYNSNYASFQPAITPTGNGSITGIVSIYGSNPQFTLRDTSDIKFTGPRCP